MGQIKFSWGKKFFFVCVEFENVKIINECNSWNALHMNDKLIHAIIYMKQFRIIKKPLKATWTSWGNILSNLENYYRGNVEYERARIWNSAKNFANPLVIMNVYMLMYVYIFDLIYNDAFMKCMF